MILNSLFIWLILIETNRKINLSKNGENACGLQALCQFYNITCVNLKNEMYISHIYVDSSPKQNKI